MTSDMLIDYFAASKYSILLNWCAHCRHHRRRHHATAVDLPPSSSSSLDACHATAHAACPVLGSASAHTATPPRRAWPWPSSCGRVSIQYLKKLEISLDKKRALQQIRLTNQEGEVVPVTFQLRKHAQGNTEVRVVGLLRVAPHGMVLIVTSWLDTSFARCARQVWLIDQLLVKT